MMCKIAISTGQFQSVIDPTTPMGLRCISSFIGGDSDEV